MGMVYLPPWQCIGGSSMKGMNSPSTGPSQIVLLGEGPIPTWPLVRGRLPGYIEEAEIAWGRGRRREFKKLRNCTRKLYIKVNTIVFFK